MIEVLHPQKAMFFEKGTYKAKIKNIDVYTSPTGRFNIRVHLKLKYSDGQKYLIFAFIPTFHPTVASMIWRARRYWIGKKVKVHVTVESFECPNTHYNQFNISWPLEANDHEILVSVKSSGKSKNSEWPI